jgi:E1A/CREB-binding protein
VYVLKPPESSGSGCSPTKHHQHTYLECLSTEHIKAHIQSLQDTEAPLHDELTSKYLEVLEGLLSRPYGEFFAMPVNPVELGWDDYFDIIKTPMDLGTIRMNIKNGSYHSLDDFKSDVHLTFENVLTYFDEGAEYYLPAKELKEKFETDCTKIISNRERSEYSTCGLCGYGKRVFKQSVIFCHRVNCREPRIRRNTFFYISADEQYTCCQKCFGANPKEEVIDCGSKVQKSKLCKRKNDEVHYESWVQCNDCKCWIHQICGLYNTHEDKESEYSCPSCLLCKREEKGEPTTLPKVPSANDIPRTNLSDWLGIDVSNKMNARIKELAEVKAKTEVRFHFS